MKTIKVEVAKFDPLADNIAPDTIIEIKGLIPEFGTLEEAGMWYEAQAKTLTDALHNSLPQAMLDRLLIALMKIKVSFYRGKMNT